MDEIQLQIYFAAVFAIFLLAIALLSRNDRIKERQRRRKLRRKRQLRYNEARQLNMCLRRGAILPQNERDNNKQTVTVKGCFADETKESKT